MIQITNEDNMQLMARYPDKYFEKINIYFATLTSKYVSLYYENIQRITDWESWRVHDLCRLNTKGVYCLPERTRATLRRTFRRWYKVVKGASENNLLSEGYSSKIEGDARLYFQHQKSREKQFKKISGRGDRLICFSLFRHQKSGLSTFKGYAGYFEYSGGFTQGDVLRRERNCRLSKSDSYKKFVSNTDSQRFGLTCGASKQNAEGGVQTV